MSNYAIGINIAFWLIVLIAIIILFTIGLLILWLKPYQRARIRKRQAEIIRRFIERG